jgi:hypothetical protein
MFVDHFCPPESGSGSNDLIDLDPLIYSMVTTTPNTPIHYLLVILEYGNLKHEGSHQLLVEVLQRNDDPAGGLVKFNNLSKRTK